MVKININDFDLGQICDSGQCFRMYRVGDDKKHITGLPNEYEITARDKYLRMAQEGCEVYFACSDAEYEEFWKKYFDIDEDIDYAKVKAMVDPKDKYLCESIKTGSGIRILKQDLWEMIVSFLISQQNNIPRIHKCIDNICKKYGKKINLDGEGYFYSFPTPEELAFLPEEALMECNLGYRSKYVVRTAKDIVDGKFDLATIEKMDYMTARSTLLQMYGVGVKVADCICLFALHHLQAFPIDTHINQVLEREYKCMVTASGKAACELPDELKRYEGVQGVIQQYIFYAELQKSKK